MTWVLCTSGDAIAKAGLNANATITASGACLATWSDEAESLASSLARANLSGGYSGYQVYAKKILGDYCSSYIAQKIINYDMSGYTSRGEAVQMLNILENNIRRIQDLLKEDKNKSVVGIS